MKRISVLLATLLLMSCGNNTQKVSYDKFHEKVDGLTDSYTLCTVIGENRYKYFTESEPLVETVEVTYEKTVDGWVRKDNSLSPDVLSRIPIVKRAKDFQEESDTKYYISKSNTYYINHLKEQTIDGYHVIDKQYISFARDGVAFHYEELYQENDDSYIGCEYTLTWM